MTARRYPPPPDTRLPWRVHALAWWAGVGQPVWQRWARRGDTIVLGVMPLLMLAALLLMVILPYVASRPHQAPAACTLVGSTWSCTSTATAAH